MSKFLVSTRRWGPIAAAAVTAAVMAGCAPFGQQPDQQKITPVEQLDPGLALHAAKGQADVDAQWWRTFGDPQLDRVLADALAGAPSLKAQRARVDEALAQADVSAADSLPLLGAAVSATPTRLPRSYTTPPPAAGHWQVNAQALLNASFDLDVAGRLRALTRAATLRAGEQQSLERAATVSLQAALVETYLQLALELQLLDIANDTLRQHDYLLRLTRQREAAGLDMPVAVARAGEPLPLAQADVERQRAAVALLRHRLAALVGRGPGYADTLTPSPRVLHAATPLPAALPAALVGRRPDILAARYRVEAASADIDAARAAFYPDINLMAFAGVQSFGFRALLHGSSGTFGAGPAITLPIFEGGRLRAGLRAQTDAYNAAVADYDDTVVNALAQVSDSLVQLDALARQRDLNRDALARAQQTYDIETRRYQKGISGYLDVLLAETRLLEDRRSVARADTSLAVEHVRLIAALGGATNPGAQQ
ncbi:efflux transporter outer membrane subunit [Burkholderia cepacia]|uniref:efflux transporter outer membrane subunit n=1 Tax=Burkholderia cepacia TaxID=292 RepID=UPI0013F465B2|nr:efflux transporter outer membrane subunit [Burkholderia cepacia]NHB06155.1 efflux transporter outer membrane subunit [Burkholderia cepacia]